jgi:Flp pilus assembly protein TadG
MGDKMLSFITKEFRRLRKEEKGVVLIIFVLVLVPLLLVIAVGIDFSQTLVVKRQLANGVDAAALAIGTQRGLTDQAEMEAEAERYIKAHYPEVIGTLTNYTVVRTSDDPRIAEIHVTATAEVVTNFMKLGGVETLTVSVESTVLRQDKELEVVMVLDNSGSMGVNNKMASMQSAANKLVDTLYGDETESDTIRIGLVPFTSAVNVGVPSSTSWLDKSTPAPLNQQYLDVPVTINLPIIGNVIIDSAFGVLDLIGDGVLGGVLNSWGGCVRSRYRFRPGGTSIDDLDITDTPPVSFDPDTLFSAYLDPVRGPNVLNYLGLTGDRHNGDCPDAAIQPLTNQKNDIKDAISAMRADGATNVPEALGWGWRAISPGEPFDEGKAYSETGVIKAIILLTDGENSIAGAFSSYGKPDSPQLQGNPNGALNTKTTQVCNNIKANHDNDSTDEDILLYTIVFNVNSGTIINLMQNCATTPTPNEFYFNSPSATDLDSAFQTIAASLNQLRIKE